MPIVVIEDINQSYEKKKTLPAVVENTRRSSFANKLSMSMIGESSVFDRKKTMSIFKEA